MGEATEVFSYFGRQLEEHREEALDAFCRIYKMGPYREGDDEPSAASVVEAVSLTMPASNIDELLAQIRELHDRGYLTNEKRDAISVGVPSLATRGGAA